MKGPVTFLFFMFVLCFSSLAFADYDCFTCHWELSNVVKHKAAEISCNLCHIDHELPSKNAYRLKKPVNQLCQTCHKGIQVRHKPVEHPNNMPIPASGKINNFTCVSCHNPHQSKMPKLIRYDYNQPKSPYRGVLCGICHGDIYGIPENVPMPRGDVYGKPE